MWRNRILFGILIGVAMGLTVDVRHQVPIWENRAFYAVIFAYFAGVVAQKYPAPKLSNAKSFRLLKGADKW